MQTVTVEISPEGGVKVQTSGFKGASCLAATAALEAALGSVQQTAKTPEFFQVETQSRPQQAKAGQ